jgi:hypothetical protein
MRKCFALSLLVLLVAACTSEDWTQELTYAGPTEINLEPGEFLAGSDIQYVSKEDTNARLLIGGQHALKKVGDSVDWQGEMLNSVHVEQSLRVAFFTNETLHLAGTVQVGIATPQPQAEPANTSAPVHWKVPVAYHVEKGQAIPGSVVTYLGRTDQGAQLGNIEGYAYRKFGDSIVWQGKLRDGVWVELDLRTGLILDDSLDLAGTVDLWLAPGQ